MSAFPIEMVRGKHLLLPAPSLNQALTSPISPNIELRDWKQIEWGIRLDAPVIKATNFNGKSVWLSPKTGETLQALSHEQIKGIAIKRYHSSNPVVDVQLLELLPFEVRHLSDPMYIVTFDDWINSTFYLHPLSGDVKSVRTDIWRLYDFFWMLHIMDYQDRKDFNHPLLIVAAVSSLFFTMSGIVLLYFSLIKPFIKRRLYQSKLQKRTL